ncbi:Antirestriction protein [uncultured Sphingopyxis sp.]|uniref:Antirestriction protein ArdC n=2 Tax=Sphingopyxis TaxID=165697 RepID=A0A7W9ETG9_9SPHN|nr:antirestriction protein ArdC [Sphingopyxis panaciterrulae]SBV32595.1 Antirestriction protein [uncultured Sphingopyxis sp.]
MNAFPQALGKAAPSRSSARRGDRGADSAGGAATRGRTRDKGRTGDGVRGGAPGVSLYDEVTARIVGELEEGRIPWVRPWDAAAFAPGLPRNAETRRSYSGINILILWSEAVQRGFAAQGWLTFNQARQAGGQVRKGEKGTTIFYAARFTPQEKGGRGAGGAAVAPASVPDGRSGAGGASGEGGDRSIPFLKRFTVFNVAQVEGLPERCTAPDPLRLPRETIPVAEALLAASGADIRIGGNEAYYSPSGDFVALPHQQAFRAQIDFYRTALHELGHWTGHRSRLDRDQTGGFGSAAYGREELCAELASAFLCASLGIAPTVRHADYIGAWLAIMRADTRAIFKAASLASKAADYLLAFAPAPAGGDIEGAPAAARGMGAARHEATGGEAGQ